MVKQHQIYNRRRDLEQGFAYSQAVRVGNQLFISGSVSWDMAGNVLGQGDWNTQVRNAYEDLKATLTHFGASFRDVVKETVYCRDMDRMIEANEVRKSYFAACPPPASTWVEVSRLALPDLLVEIEMTALLDD